jgi:magnesium transporter
MTPARPADALEPAAPPPRSGGGTMLRAVTAGAGRDLQLGELPAALADAATNVWVDLGEPQPDHLASVASILGLHPLVAHNISERSQRARIQIVDEHAQIVLFAVDYVGEVRESEVDFVLGRRFLLTVHDSDWDPTRAPLLRSGPDALLARGPDYLFYALGDWIVDGYFPCLDQLGDEIDDLQDDAVQRASPWVLQRLFTLKRELIGLRRAVSPAREIFNQLTNREISVVSSENVIYLRDVYDHLLRLTDELDNYRELVAGTLEVYLSTINNNLSVIMKRLTGVTVLLAGIGAIAGIFGMSEAGTALGGAEAAGFWIVTLFTVVVAGLAAVVLRRINWI